MRGTYRGEERGALREDWRLNHIPHFIAEEISPIDSFLAGRKSITAIDCGANKGFWSKALLNTYRGKISQIYMVDASPENYRELTNHEDNLIFDETDLKKVTAIHSAVSNKVGAITLFTSEDGSPMGSLYPHLIGDEHTMSSAAKLTESFSVPCDTVDNIIQKHAIAHVDILKLDIEGEELNAILGADKNISSGNIDLIFFEFGCHQVDARHFFRDFYSYFVAKNYKLHKIVEGSTRAISEYSYHHENFTTCCNMIASRG